MNAATLEFLKQKFTSYYSRAVFEAPSSLEQREWGFIFFDQPNTASGRPAGMKRHISFTTPEEMSGYIKNMLPRHAYYSTAYYAKPSAGSMADKMWSGADLIFDLDADHIVKCAYDEMLSRVKDETLKIVDMLTHELGFSPKEIHPVFSGGRGYHIHISNPEVIGWGSQERRELVDYVCGIGLDPGIMLNSPDETMRQVKGHSKKSSGADKNAASEHSWQYRYRDAIREYISDLKQLGDEESVKKLEGIKGISKESAKEFMSRSDTLMRSLKKNGSAIPMSRVLKVILTQEDSGFDKYIKDRAALTDEPVTTDIKRLIRMQGSLHGGSGFKVMNLTIRELADFDPLTDAVIFGEEPVKIEMNFPVSMPILGNNYSLQKGANVVPQALAVFMCARGIAEYLGR